MRHSVPLGSRTAHSSIGIDYSASAWGFSLLEVMIALTIFFVAIFTILGSVSRSLGAARSLQQKFPDISALVADLMLTNKVEEGTGGGDFGDLFPGYTWTGYTNQIRTNGLFQIDFVIQSRKGRELVEWTNSIYLWRPDSKVSAYGTRL
jgi:Tfp pilus assembly protein PilV